MVESGLTMVCQFPSGHWDASHDIWSHVCSGSSELDLLLRFPALRCGNTRGVGRVLALENAKKIEYLTLLYIS